MSPRAAVGLVALTLVLISVIAPPPAIAAGAEPLIPPVDAPILRRFERPATDFGPGHRGLDYAASAGTPVRAAAAGIVRFAGQVGGRLAVTVDHGGGLRTTYSNLGRIQVEVGDRIGQGRYVGTAEEAHPGGPWGLHFGALVDDRYIDPLTLLGPLDVSGAIHLAPMGDGSPTCRTPGALPRSVPPPNDNIAVAIAGLNSSDAGTTPQLLLSALGPRALGYPRDRMYTFSYRGPGDPGRRRPYRTRDTWADLRAAAARLHGLLAAVGRRHPGAEVDLVAHSQGAIVARIFLEGLAPAWDPRLPRVEHLVTLAAPHLGAPLAELVRDLDATATGPWAVDGVGAWARSGGALPHPRARAVRQLAPGSPLLSWLATEDVTVGTRVLSLASAGDVVVPAPRSFLTGARNYVLAPAGWNSHRALLRSEDARAHAYLFLRDAEAACGGRWERAGGVTGRAIDFAQRHAGDILRALEPPGAAAASRALRWVGRRAAGVLAVLRPVLRPVGRRVHDAVAWGARRLATGWRTLGAALP
jgi:hypothetical protein